MTLAQRLACLVGVIAVLLILGTTELTLSFTARSRLDDLRRESEALAETWAVYLNRAAPKRDSTAVAQALSSWPNQSITATAAAVVTRGADGRWSRIAGTERALGDVTAWERRALAERTMMVWREEAPRPAWRVSMPIGRGAPWGVLSVAVSTQALEVQARSERRRAYPLAFATAILLSVAIWWLSQRWVGRPLEDLEDAMERTKTQGPGVSEAAPLRGPAEFRRLAGRYNELEKALESRERESAARGELLAMEERARGIERVLMAEQAGAEFAHEIGTPLNTVSGHLQLLREDLAGDGSHPDEANRVDAVLAQVNRVSGIVRAKLHRGAWPVAVAGHHDLMGLADQVRQFVEPALGNGRSQLHIRTIPADRSSQLLVWCDPALVQQILLNLFKNAVEAMPQGGEIVFEGGREGDNVWLRVADSGPGMSDAARKHVFEPYSTTKGAAGTGLGLTVSRRLARAMRGDLELVPTQTGTTWRLTLPADPPAQ